MSHNRKLEDAKHRHARAQRNMDEAHVRSNQTGRSSDRQAYIEALAEVADAAEDILAAQMEVTP